MLLPYLNKDLIEAGCDEAGRGCLAGSVYAAAVILPVDFKNELLNDSKQLTEHQRYALREIVERETRVSFYKENHYFCKNTLDYEKQPTCIYSPLPAESLMG